MMDILILEFIWRLVFKHGSIEMLMNGSIHLYTLLILPLRIGIVKLNFAEALRLSVCSERDSS